MKISEMPIDETVHDSDVVPVLDQGGTNKKMAFSTIKEWVGGLFVSKEDLQNNGETVDSGYALDARYGKTLADQMASTGDEITELKNELSEKIVFTSTRNLYDSDQKEITLVSSSQSSRTKTIILETNIPSGKSVISFKVKDVVGVSLLMLQVFDVNNDRILDTNTSNLSNTISFNVISETDYNRLYFAIQLSQEIKSLTIYDIQIELGDSYSEYIPHIIACDPGARDSIDSIAEAQSNFNSSVNDIKNLILYSDNYSGTLLNSSEIVESTVITVDNTNASKIIRTAKNLINVPDVELNRETKRTAQYTFPVEIPSGIEYTLSADVTDNNGVNANVQLFDSNNTLITSVTKSTNFFKTFTPVNPIHHIYMYLASSLSSEATATVANIQLEYGGNATEYNEYNGTVTEGTHAEFEVTDIINNIWSDSGNITANYYKYKLKQIQYIDKESSNGLIDTYVIHYSDGSESRYNVTNGDVDATEAQDIINTLLQSHPEWTTTVQDNAITEQKINSLFLPSIKNIYITPEMFGAQGDGTTDDTTAIQDAIDYAGSNNVTLFFSTGKTYLITHISIDINTQSIDFHDCVLKAGTSGTMVSITGTANTPNGYIRNLTLDMNNIADIGIGFTNCWRKTISDIQINNAPNNGIGIYVYGSTTESGKSGGNLITNIRGRTYNPGAAIIDINAGDNTFSNIDWINYTKGIIVRRWSTLSNIHGFIGGDSFYPNSTFMECHGRFMGTNLYPDTQESCFYMDSGANGSMLVNVFTCFNTESVSSSLMESTPPVCFRCPQNSSYDLLKDTLVYGLYFDLNSIYTGTNMINLNPYSMKIIGVSGRSGSSFIPPLFKISTNSQYFNYNLGGFQYEDKWNEELTTLSQVPAGTTIGQSSYDWLKLVDGVYVVAYEYNNTYSSTVILVESNMAKTTEVLPQGCLLYVNIPNITSK